MSVENSKHVLLDDGTVVQHFSNVVARRPNQLNTALKRRVIRLRTAEGRKERVTHIDDLARVSSDRTGREFACIAPEL